MANESIATNLKLEDKKAAQNKERPFIEPQFRKSSSPSHESPLKQLGIIDLNVFSSG